MVQVSIPFFESATGIVVNKLFADPYLWIFLALLLIFITVLSGSYPSFLLSSFQPVKILKGEIWGGYQYVLLRKTLVAFQFGISIFMIIATLVIGRQLDFMREKDLGFAREQVLMVRMNNEVIRDRRENFRNALMSLREVQFVSSMTGHPGGGYFDATTVNVEGFEEKIRMRTLFADEDFSRVLSLDFAAGRSFSRAYPSDPGSSVILNETAVRQLGWEPGEAIGKRVRLAQFDSVFKQVVGVVKDFHFLSLKVKIEPLIISCQARGAMLVKLSGDNMTRTLSDMEKLWKTYDTGFPLEWMFLDEMVNRLYRKESEQGKIFTCFSILSVFIACLGILGLTSFLVTQRRKEIGIRKVLGADTGQLSFLLMKDTMELVLAANLLAIPIGYFAIEMWLESFAYRIPISPVVFLSGSLIVFIAAFVIVGIRVAQTALENPTKALRSE
jgi:putative ABC transport system permease protein